MAAKKKSKRAATAPAIPEVLPGQLELPAEEKIRAALATQEYRITPINELKLHPKNPKKGNVDAIGQSIDQNKFYGAIYAQKSTGYMLAGNHRWQGAHSRGLEKVPVIWIDCDDATAERILLGDNRIADLGTYDDTLLFQLLEARRGDGGLAGTGYGDADLDRMKQKLASKPDFPEFNEQVKVHYNCPNCGFTWS